MTQVVVYTAKTLWAIASFSIRTCRVIATSTVGSSMSRYCHKIFKLPKACQNMRKWENTWKNTKFHQSWLVTLLRQADLSRFCDKWDLSLLPYHKPSEHLTRYCDNLTLTSLWCSDPVDCYTSQNLILDYGFRDIWVWILNYRTTSESSLALPVRKYYPKIRITYKGNAWIMQTLNGVFDWRRNTRLILA